MKVFWITVLVVTFIGCGKDDNNEATNSGTNTGTTPVGECNSDEDCPGASTATFADPSAAKCTESITVRGNYCSECIFGSQCARGFACRDATYCEELPPCSSGSDCADTPGDTVHPACIAGFCDTCTDDLDCEGDEICYSKNCVTRTEVDPTCIDASCDGPCEVEFDENGASTGVGCSQ